MEIPIWTAANTFGVLVALVMFGQNFNKIMDVLRKFLSLEDQKVFDGLVSPAKLAGAFCLLVDILILLFAVITTKYFRQNVFAYCGNCMFFFGQFFQFALMGISYLVTVIMIATAVASTGPATYFYLIKNYCTETKGNTAASAAQAKEMAKLLTVIQNGDGENFKVPGLGSLIAKFNGNDRAAQFQKFCTDTSSFVEGTFGMLGAIVAIAVFQVAIVAASRGNYLKVGLAGEGKAGEKGTAGDGDVTVTNSVQV